MDVHVGDGKVFTQDDAWKLNYCYVEMCKDKSLFIGNLPDGASEKQIAQTFEKYGRVTKVEINEDPKLLTRKNKTRCPNFGFLEFDTEEAVHQTLRSTPIKLFGHHDLFVEKIKVCYCVVRPPAPSWHNHSWCDRCCCYLGTQSRGCNHYRPN